jgi:GLPGLI family protein
MYLDISEKGSKFYSREVYVSDSIMTAAFEKQIKATGSMNVDMKAMSMRKGSVRYKIHKNYPSLETYSLTRSGMDAYKVWDKRKIPWKILPEKQKIGEFEAQKAVTEFAGRKWTAWFTEELPFQDGPYKFRGLPGLIVKLEDATQSHVFELKAVGKYKEEIQKVSEFVGNDKYIEVNQEQYKKIFLEDRNDPAKSMKMAMANGAVLQFRDQNGNEISASEMIKRREQQVKENNKRDNNLLELDLLQ